MANGWQLPWQSYGKWHGKRIANHMAKRCTFTVTYTERAKAKEGR